MDDKLKHEFIKIIKHYELKDLPGVIELIEESMIRSSIELSKNYNAAADRLRISKSTMYRKMKQYGIPKKRTNTLASSEERNVSGITLQEGIHSRNEDDCSS